jgi:acyl-CoA thioester hydrolase
MPARLDDALDVGVALRQCRRASLVIVQTVERSGVRLLDAEVRVAALRASDFRPRPLPDTLYPQLMALQDAASKPPDRSHAE